MQQKVFSNIWSSPFDNVHAHQLLAILFDEHHLELRILGCWSSVEVGVDQRTRLYTEAWVYVPAVVPIQCQRYGRLGSFSLHDYILDVLVCLNWNWHIWSFEISMHSNTFAFWAKSSLTRRILHAQHIGMRNSNILTNYIPNGPLAHVFLLDPEIQELHVNFHKGDRHPFHQLNRRHYRPFHENVAQKELWGLRFLHSGDHLPLGNRINVQSSDIHSNILDFIWVY